MATKHSDPVPATTKEIKRNALPMSSSSTNRIRPRPSSPSAKSSTTAVPNYLKPTASSKTDVGLNKSPVGKKKHSHDHHEMHKPNPTAIRRRSFDKPVPASQVHKAVHQSSSSARVVGKTNALSSERVSKVVKAVKSQPPIVKTKSLPKGFASSSKKEVAKMTLKVVVTTDEESSLDVDVDVEEELAKLESPVGTHEHLPPTEKQLEHDHVVDDQNHKPLAANYVDDIHLNQEKLNTSDDEEHDEKEHKPVAEDVKVHNEETREVQESQNVNEVLTEDDGKNEKEEDIMKDDGGVRLTVKTSTDEVAEGEEEEEEEREEEKQSAKSETAISVVHKRQIGGPMNKKESPAYNDVIEETASKLVEKRVNKVRALAGAFETVISLEQPGCTTQMQ